MRFVLDDLKRPSAQSSLNPLVGNSALSGENINANYTKFSGDILFTRGAKRIEPLTHRNISEPNLG